MTKKLAGSLEEIPYQLEALTFAYLPGARIRTLAAILARPIPEASQARSRSPFGNYRK
ncbi:MAG: hypothetical protein IH897_05975 [Planctomycetes bacterium]|nr:hypothetical protein [Planctomycetota bacterium]